jgi:hypothetical protein
VKRSIITIIITLNGLLATLALPYLPTAAKDDQAVLRFSPATLELAPGTQGMVAVVVENMQDLYGLEFQVSFDPKIVEVMYMEADQEGIQIMPADWWKDGFMAVNKVDNESGRIDFAATMLRPA